MRDINQKSSRLPGFYELSFKERSQLVANFSDLSAEEKQKLDEFGALDPELADTFIENAVGTFSLPLGVATNFRINGKDILVPMAVEESSVLAAASHGAKLARFGGGFTTWSTASLMTGQIQVYISEKYDYNQKLIEHKQTLLDYANRGQVNLLARGGGAKDLSWYYIKEIKSLVILLYVDTCDAMGANIVNTMCEKLAVFMPELFPSCRVGLRILTNLTLERRASASCFIPPEAFSKKIEEGQYTIDRIVEAYEFAAHDILRATTNNKGVMNGIDPVVIATGNDWRAIEAGAHAYCCRNGRYEPMTRWKKHSDGRLHGEIELPMAVGTVGGVTRLHPTAKTALKLLGSPSARDLSEIICAVGLAQNLSALRALATEGIQQGHMGLHQKNLNLLKGYSRTRAFH